MQENQTSLSLLVRVRGRDAAAWQRLVSLYAPLVHFWSQRWGAQAGDADDIRQEVFLAVSQRLDTFRRDRPGDTFRGWLRVIAYRKFLDHCRARQHQPARLDDVDEPWDKGEIPGELEDSPDEVRLLHHRALEMVRSEFEESSWQAFWRTAVESRLPADVAREMNMTPAAVRKAKSRVLIRLREELGELLE